MSEQKQISIGFIGAGMMASAIMGGVIDKKVVKGPESVSCSDIWEGALEKARAKGIFATKSSAEVCERPNDAIILAVKPDTIITVCKDIMAVEGFNALIISVAAGVTLDTLESNLPGHRVVRVMPNTPCMVGQSASGFAMGQKCTDADREIVVSIFGSCGIAHEVKEVLLNGVTGVSGSGPAYVFQFIEALADGGVRCGLPRAQALELAAQTVKGAAEMVLATGQNPAVLKDQVCSPGGTTIAGVEQLEKGGLRSAVINAVKASTRRSMQLGGISESEIASKYNL
mmetsp:Transcript_767/g.1001  ORF Transcript_767/g.1001 Transcript_767/m.1001 type:complete len:285 (+) Transcript_767:159-1013(+)|eukprot:CAMPEP_0198142888 /NCGR_PEP_ID=MMETSP1443-20131203/5558_1 /TAXON_ID=186043 /ORGANISM="Entomoneis sp., Strain CCMP2396" /LENGTH=284 /DNA_ID=CAMNT_0043806007 /DNA_START=111 /DNA_END=965 /DNA_ORIENTATION=-